MTLQELGVHLSEIRQGKKISIESVANILKLSPRVVQGMESANLDELPPAAYASAFYRAYAKILNIDAELIRTALEEIDCEQVEDVTTLHLPIKASGRRQRVLIFLFVLVMAIFAGLYTLMSSSMLSDMSSVFSKPKVQYSDQVFSGSLSVGQAPSEQNMAQAAPALMPTQQMKQTQQVKSNALTTVQPEGLQANIAQTVMPLNSQKNTLSPQTNRPSLATPARPVLPVPAPVITANTTAATNLRLQMGVGTRHILVLTGVGSCWVKVTSDGLIRQFSIQKGQTLQIRFDRQAVLLLGSAGDVRADLDGKALPPLGALGEVRTVTFPRS